MIEIVIDPKFTGPSIIDQQFVLRNIQDDVIELRWSNKREEIAVLNRFLDLNFRFFVSDALMQEKSAITLGLPVEFENNTMNEAKLALNTRKSYDWRKFCEQRSHVYTRNLLIRIAADSLRKGKESCLAAVVADLAKKSGINLVEDADILLRLKALQG